MRRCYQQHVRTYIRTYVHTYVCTYVAVLSRVYGRHVPPQFSVAASHRPPWPDCDYRVDIRTGANIDYMLYNAGGAAEAANAARMLEADTDPAKQGRRRSRRSRRWYDNKQRKEFEAAAASSSWLGWHDMDDAGPRHHGQQKHEC